MTTVTEVWTNILLDKLLQDNFLSEDSHKFGMNIRLEKGALYINDKPRTMTELDEISSYWDFSAVVAPDSKTKTAIPQ